MDNTRNRFELFFEAFRALTPPPPQAVTPEDRMRLFFSAFSRMHPLLQPEPAPPEPEWDLNKFRTFFEEGRAHLNTYRKGGHSFNLWELVDLGRDEMRHSKLLSWFIDCQGSHGQGDSFLKAFLTLIPDALWHGNTAPHLSAIRHCVTRTEVVPANDDKSRMDITVAAESFLLYIEVKLDALETGNQLDRYIEVAQARACGRPWAVVFLTIGGYPPQKSSPDKICCLRWKDVGRELARATIQCSKTHEFCASPAYYTAMQFCQHIQTL